MGPGRVLATIGIVTHIGSRFADPLLESGKAHMKICSCPFAFVNDIVATYCSACLGAAKLSWRRRTSWQCIDFCLTSHAMACLSTFYHLGVDPRPSRTPR